MPGATHAGRRCPTQDPPPRRSLPHVPRRCHRPHMAPARHWTSAPGSPGLCRDPPAIPFPHHISTASSPPAHLPRPGRDWRKVGGTGGPRCWGLPELPGVTPGQPRGPTRMEGDGGVVAAPPARSGSEMGRRASAVGCVTRRDRARRGASAAPASAGKTCPPSHGTRAPGQPSHGCLCPGERGSLRDHLGGLQRGHPDPAKGRGPRTAGLREPRHSAHTSRMCQDNCQPRQHVG